MGGRWFSDYVVSIEGKEGMEAIQGVWIAEILREGLGMKRNDKDYLTKSREIGQFLNTLKGSWEQSGRKRSKIYGQQRMWDNKLCEVDENFCHTLNDL